jgi:lipopolysaccharide biosynthesis glycosyltransferase
MDKTDRIYLCTFASGSYIQHACVLIKSLIKVKNKNKDYEVFFFYSEAKESDFHKVKNEFEKIKGVFINYIFCNTYKQHENNLRLNHTSMSIYAKIFIYDLIPNYIKKILFLDADIVLLQDPAELFETDLKNFTIGAIQDHYYKKVHIEMKEAINLNSDNDYFNSGVMLINLTKWKNENISSKSLEFMKSHGEKNTFP